jgi:hypothetical protein
LAHARRTGESGGNSGEGESGGNSGELEMTEVQTVGWICPRCHIDHSVQASETRSQCDWLALIPIHSYYCGDANESPHASLSGI